MSKNKIKISTHLPFQPLKAMLLGQGVSENFFDWVNDPKIKNPLRHRYFWDGGIHCLTLDLIREEDKENYF